MSYFVNPCSAQGPQWNGVDQDIFAEWKSETATQIP
jgi:hypothetical protein